MKIGPLIDKMKENRDARGELNDKIKELEAEYARLEGLLMEAMDKEGVTKSTGGAATASISTSIVPQVEDWDEFYKYIHKHKFYHLLERRPSAAGCREIMEEKKKLPGVVPFVKRKINLRTL
jgi:hypothetical protein